MSEKPPSPFSLSPQMEKYLNDYVIAISNDAIEAAATLADGLIALGRIPDGTTIRMLKKANEK